MPVTVLNPEPGFEWTRCRSTTTSTSTSTRSSKRLKIQPAPLADDATFLRRVYLDLIGIPPTPEEARAFLDNPDKSRLKRERLIDALMERKEFVDHWSLKWGDLLQSNRKHLGEKGTWAFRQWIRDCDCGQQALRQDGARADHGQPAAPIRIRRRTSSGSTTTPKLAMENTTQLFLGVRMVCTQCHDHPFEKWTQNQYYQLTAFFAAVGVKPGFDSDEDIVYLKRDGYDIKHPKNNRVVDSAIPGGERRRAADRFVQRPPRGVGRLADFGKESLLRARHRQPHVELLLRPRHHRTGRRHPRVESAGQRAAAGSAGRRISSNTISTCST